MRCKVRHFGSYTILLAASSGGADWWYVVVTPRRVFLSDNFSRFAHGRPGRRGTGHRGQGDVRHGSLFKNMHKTPNEHVATCMGPNPHPKRMLLCPAFLHVGPKSMLACVRALAAVAVAQWMARQLPWPGISWLEGAMDDDAARCAVGRKASPAAQSVCLELPQILSHLAVE